MEERRRKSNVVWCWRRRRKNLELIVIGHLSGPSVHHAVWSEKGRGWAERGGVVKEEKES